MSKITLSEAARKKRLEYMRQWRAKPENKKKQREYMRRYRAKNRDREKRAVERYWERKAQEE